MWICLQLSVARGGTTKASGHIYIFRRPMLLPLYLLEGRYFASLESLYLYVPDEGSLLPKYRDCTTYNDFEYIYLYIYIYI